jgi:hypothetical protein
MVSRVLAQRGDIALDRSTAREGMLVLHANAVAQASQRCILSASSGNGPRPFGH